MEEEQQHGDHPRRAADGKQHDRVLERGFEPKEGGVYISYYLFGSPAHKHKLVPKHWIVELNGKVVPDLPQPTGEGFRRSPSATSGAFVDFPVR